MAWKICQVCYFWLPFRVGNVPFLQIKTLQHVYNLSDQTLARYKQLKKMLKKCRPADQPEAPLNKEEEDAFFEELLSELRSINRYFKVEADRTVSAYQRQIYGIYFLFFYIPLCTSGPRKYAALAERAYWCRKYARANAVALRKILKKT